MPPRSHDEIRQAIETTRHAARSGPPSFQSGDYWKGSLYFDTTTNKLRVNTGGLMWVDLH